MENIQIGLEKMSSQDVADYMDSLCDDLQLNNIDQEYFDQESNAIEKSYPSKYYAWLR